jgi:hypothetical protein
MTGCSLRTTAVGITCISALLLTSACSLLKGASAEAGVPAAPQATTQSAPAATPSTTTQTATTTAATAATAIRTVTSTKPAPPVSDADRLTVAGLGPLTIGMTRAELLAAGLMEPTTELCEGSIAPVKSVSDRGIWLLAVQNLYMIEVNTSQTHTKSGAHVGMTMAQLRNIYGADVQLQKVPYGTQGGTIQAYTITGPKNILIFFSTTGQAGPNDVVATIVLKPNDGLAIPTESC